MKIPLLIVASFLLAAFLYGNIDIANEAYADWDFHQYVKIAEAAPRLDPTVERPFAFRFLPHYLIGMIPLNVHYSYMLLNYTAILILLMVLYRFLLSREVPARSGSCHRRIRSPSFAAICGRSRALRISV